MKIPLRSFVATTVLLLCFHSDALCQQAFDDSSYRQSAAQRIKRTHGLEFDWRSHSLLVLTDYEARLNTASRIKRDHGLTFEWRKTSLLTLTDAEARLNTAKRIERDHGVKFDWQKSSLLSLTDAESRLNAVLRIQRSTGKKLDWQSHSLLQLMQQKQKLSQTGHQRVPSSTLPTTVRMPRTGQVGSYYNDTREDVRSEADDLSWEIQKLRRNVSDYDPDEYARTLKRLEWDLEELSSRAEDVGADDASALLDDASWDVRKVRRDVEGSKSYFYGEREDDINRRLKRIEWDTEDASWDIDEDD